MIVLLSWLFGAGSPTSVCTHCIAFNMDSRCAVADTTKNPIRWILLLSNSLPSIKTGSGLVDSLVWLKTEREREKEKELIGGDPDLIYNTNVPRIARSWAGSYHHSFLFFSFLCQARKQASKPAKKQRNDSNKFQNWLKKKEKKFRLHYNRYINKFLSLNKHRIEQQEIHTTRLRRAINEDNYETKSKLPACLYLRK